MTDHTEPRPRSVTATSECTSATILRLPASPRKAGQDASAAALSSAADLSSATIPLLAPFDSPLDVLFAAFGHDEACRAAVRSGKVLGCRCGAAKRTRKSFAASEAAAASPPGLAGDAAPVIGLALRYARLLRPRRLPLPLGIARALVSHVDAGDPAAVVVWQWCVLNGLIGDVGNARPILRVAAAREVQP